MTRAELEHAIRAVCDLTLETEVIVFGSQAILGQFPNAPDALRQSAEADIAPKRDGAIAEQLALEIDGALGLGSDFHQAHGFYVHGVPIEAATLPEGWRERTIPVRNANTRHNTGLCVEVHDLAASKLAAFREKDRDFVRVLLLHDLVRPITLQLRLRQLPDDPADPARQERLLTWLDRTLKELGRAGRAG